MLAVHFKVASLGADYPFGILVTPERVLSQPIVGDLAQGLGITSTDNWYYPSPCVRCIALIAGAVKFLTWANTKLAFSTGADLGIEIYRRTLYQLIRCMRHKIVVK